MVAIAESLGRIRDIVDRYAGGRHVDIMLAAKHQPIERLIEAYDAGGVLMGHNLVDQLVSADAGLAEHGIHPYTSMIGHVQSNKLSSAMTVADRIDTVDSLKTAQRINRRQEERVARGEATGPYPVLIQINSAAADTQFGVAIGDVMQLAVTIADLPWVQIRGVMTIGARGSETNIRASFATTRRLSEEMRTLPALADADVISMGMSNDMHLAISEGATVVRVGTAVFGER